MEYQLIREQLIQLVPIKRYQIDSHLQLSTRLLLTTIEYF